MGKLKERHHLMRLAHIAGDIGELRQERSDAELGQALDLIRVLLERVAREMTTTTDWPDATGAGGE